MARPTTEVFLANEIYRVIIKHLDIQGLSSISTKDLLNSATSLSIKGDKSEKQLLSLIVEELKLRDDFDPANLLKNAVDYHKSKAVPKADTVLSKSQLEEKRGKSKPSSVKRFS
jgi:hypothetical protein